MRCILFVVVAALSLLRPIDAQTVPFEKKDRPVGWVTKFMGRYQQTNQWERLGSLASSALDVGKTAENKTLLSMGQWYSTLVMAQNGAPPEDVLESLRKAVDYGYHNVQGIESADQLAVIKADPNLEPKFRDLIRELQATIFARLEKDFKMEVGAAIDASRDAELTGVLMESDSASAAKRLRVYVLSRIYHEGFSKQWASLSEARKKYGDDAAIIALFYESEADSAFVQKQVARYAQRSGVPAGSYEIIGRQAFLGLRETLSQLHDIRTKGAEKKEVFNLYFPCTIAVDTNGKPVVAQSGVLLAWQAEFLIEQALAGLPASPNSKRAAAAKALSEEKPAPDGDTSAESEKKSEPEK